MPYANPEDEKKYRRLRYRHSAKVRESKRQQYLRNRTKQIANARKSKLKIAFGLSEQAYEALFQSQNGRCAICRKTEDEALAICKKKLFVDHCHATGRIRGLLCMKCNGGLGMFGDSERVLVRALDYLRS